MTVYVYWRDKLLEGEKLDGLYMGMCQVRIPVQGFRVIALFTPSHVYATPAEASAHTKAPAPAAPVPVPASPSALSSFKAAHWDHGHNHLQVSALDEFYALWRQHYSPSVVQSAAVPQQPPRYRVGVDPAPAGKDKPSVRIYKVNKYKQLSLFD